MAKTKTKITNQERDVPRRIIQYQQPSGTNWSTTSTVNVDLGFATTYTAGDVDETVKITLDILLNQSTTGTVYLYLDIDGVAQLGRCYNNANNSWIQQTRTWLVDVDAEDTITIKLRWKVTGGTGSVSRGATTHNPMMTMESFPRQ